MCSISDSQKPSYNCTENNSANVPEFWQTKVSFNVGVYGMVIVLIIGLPANILAIMTFRRLKPKSTSTVYLQALSIANLVSLTWDTTISTAFPFLGINLLSLSQAACKVGIWADMSTSVTASCALLVVAVDRLGLLYFPAFHKYHCSRRFAAVVSLCLWPFTFAYCSPLIYFYELDSQGHCGLPSSNPAKSESGLAFVTFITYGPYFSMPATASIVGAIFILRKMWERKRLRREMVKKTEHAENDDISKLLIIDCVSFLILIGVTAILWALCWNPPINDDQRASFELMFVLAQFMCCCEGSIGLFLYLAFSKNFRTTLKNDTFIAKLNSTYGKSGTTIELIAPA